MEVSEWTAMVLLDDAIRVTEALGEVDQREKKGGVTGATPSIAPGLGMVQCGVSNGSQASCAVTDFWSTALNPLRKVRVVS